jgi:flagellar biosynthesis/type III secretory pathway M-ring protein FliF/YscJ
VEAASADALPPGITAQLTAGAGDSDEDLLLALRTASKSSNTAEALTKFLREEVHKNPRNVALLLRTWLEEERAH